jgi:hypothetical protein
MTLDHFGRPISYYLYQCFGFFSAAEGFFFLSGFVGMLAATSKGVKDPKQSWMRARAFKTWRYHIVTLVCLCLAAWLFLPRVTHFFDSLYNHPVQGSVLSLLLVNTPEWLDVLPLYVLFLLLGSFVFPLFVKAGRKRMVLLLWLPSLCVWVAAQFGLRDMCNSVFPAWVSHGFFDPFGWQFVYFSGAATASWWRIARKDEAAGDTFAVRSVKRLTPAIIVLLVFCFLWSHQFFPFGSLALPSDFFVSKDHVGVLRFVNFFAFMLGICAIVRRWPALLDFRPTNVMGRHSLDVYTAHIVLVYIWMSLPGEVRYHGPWNVIAPLTACVLLWALAKAREPRVK